EPASREVQVPVREEVREQEAEERAAVQQREPGLRIALQDEPHEEEKSHQAPEDRPGGDERIRLAAEERSARRGQERERGAANEAGDDEISEPDEHRFPFLACRDLTRQALVLPE